MTSTDPRRILRIADVVELTSLSRSTIMRQIKLWFGLSSLLIVGQYARA